MFKKNSYSPFVIALAEILRRKPAPLASFALHDMTIDIVEGAQSFWAIVRRPGRGGIALRCAFLPAGIKSLKVSSASTAGCEAIVECA